MILVNYTHRTCGESWKGASSFRFLPFVGRWVTLFGKLLLPRLEYQEVGARPSNPSIKIELLGPRSARFSQRALQDAVLRPVLHFRSCPTLSRTRGCTLAPAMTECANSPPELNPP